MKQLNWYQIFGNTHIIPDGKTVTPTDDIQILLHCANIWDKDYTTLAEVLADDDTLFLICISDNAIDYLVRSTTWANGTAFVPTMTSNTTPEGVAKSTSETSGREAYRAFDGDDSTGAAMATGNRVAYIQYKCATARKVEAFAFNCVWSPVEGCTLEVSCSDDGNTWSSCGTYIYSSSDNGKTKQYLLNADYGTHLYWRITRTLDTNSRAAIANTVQFYSAFVTASESAMQYIGASDYASETLLSDSTWLTAIDGSAYKDYVINASVPTMTSDTAPEGKCFSGVNYSSSYPAYIAFDKNNSTYWFWGPRGANNNYVGYKFTRPTKIFNMKALFSKEGSPTDVTLSIQGSVDGENDFVELTTFNTSSWVTGSNNIAVPLVSTTDYLAYRVLANGIMNQANYTTFTPAEINFYGRENAGVQTWLKAGGVEGKKYTTVSEVLSDLTTLATLMSSTDAIDYLVTAKGWATEICSDSNAMADIGMNNYAANTLLADETWALAICDSTYASSVINATVPTMTSYNTPSGQVIESSRYTTNYGWYAFDGNTNDRWAAGSQNVGEYVGYIFPTKNKIAVVGYYAASNVSYTAQLRGSNDGITWTDIGSPFVIGNSDRKKRAVYDGNKYDRYAVFAVASGIQSFIELQFYGRKDI